MLSEESAFEYKQHTAFPVLTILTPIPRVLD